MKTLAIMAAGLGSRYGGLKQLDTIDNHGNSIIDYSIYDACCAGFNDIIFIIREELLAEFDERFGHYNSAKVQISYVFQSVDDVPEDFKHITRHKPWGTGHALLVLRNHVKGNFAIINADDFYGRDAFEVMCNALTTSIDPTNFVMVSYKLQNTLSPFGYVSRGQCDVDHDHYLLRVTERTKIKKSDHRIQYLGSDQEAIPIDGETQVSMNFWGFSPSIFKYAETLFKKFLSKPIDHSDSEFYLPSIVNELLGNRTVGVKVLNTESSWYGITYKKDKEHVVKAIQDLRTNGNYPEMLKPDLSIEHIFNEFDQHETYRSLEALTSGHINDTYRIITDSGNDFVLQRINKEIFPNVKELVSNKILVSQYLKEHSPYLTSNYIKTHTGNYCLNSSGDYWTLSNYIKNTVTFLKPTDAKMAKQAGMLLGHFHKSMQGFELDKLKETIPDFHDLDFRARQFEEALNSTSKNTIKLTEPELLSINSFKKDAEFLHNLKTTGQIPLRVVHNDAKLSNILFDKTSHQALAIIDLDTVMPGIIHHDLGDAIRSICSEAQEDEADLSKVLFNVTFYKAFMEGFILIMHPYLSMIEKENLVYGIKYMIYEQALRFFTDHLNGNIYYKVDYPEHNLVRTKNQLRLLEVLNAQFEEITLLTNNLLSK